VYAAVIGISRVAVGAHRAADVVGGWLLGVAIAVAVVVVIQPGFRPVVVPCTDGRSEESAGANRGDVEQGP
jgi:membrane-associated phospholipid phosphatase